MNQRVPALILGVLVLAALGVAAGTIQHSVATGSGSGLSGDEGGAPNGSGQTPDPDQRDIAGHPPENRTIDDSSASEADRSGSGADGGTSGKIVGVVTSPVGILGLLVALAIVAVAVTMRGSGRSTPEPADTDDDERGDDGKSSLQDVGRAAGRAANRMESADPENAVYEAWLDMTHLLDVDDPTTTTPSEFADAAIAAGMTREDVDRLTAIFQRVRYGGETVTDEHEHDAQAAFRAIEAHYTDDGRPNA